LAEIATVEPKPDKSYTKLLVVAMKKEKGRPGGG
jgi:hypothetical protein